MDSCSFDLNSYATIFTTGARPSRPFAMIHSEHQASRKLINAPGKPPATSYQLPATVYRPRSTVAPQVAGH
jgi:hypothetical protein